MNRADYIGLFRNATIYYETCTARDSKIYLKRNSDREKTSQG